MASFQLEEYIAFAASLLASYSTSIQSTLTPFHSRSRLRSKSANSYSRSRLRSKSTNSKKTDLNDNFRGQTDNKVSRCCNPGSTCREAEFLNALSMLAPLVVSLCFVWKENSWQSCLIATEAFLHSLFSISHHLNLALGDPEEGQVKKGLMLRRLDYTFIQLDSVVLAFTMSGSFVYGVMSVLINLYFIFTIWTDSRRPQQPNLLYHAFAGVICIGAAIIKGSYFDALVVASGFYVAFDFTRFQRIGHKYSHALFHLVLGPQLLLMIVISSPDVFSRSFGLQ